MDGVRFGGVFRATLRDRFGNYKWSDTFHNRVVSTGLQYILSVALQNGTAVSTWHIGLLPDATTPATGERMSTKAWTEVTAYDEANRPTFTESRTGVSVSNTGNLSTFTIDADGTTIGGAFLCSSNSKGGSSGVLLAGGAFSGGSKSGDSGDKLEVTYTFTAADA